MNLDIQALNLDEALYVIKTQKSSKAGVDEEDECSICLDSPLQVSCMAKYTADHVVHANASRVCCTSHVCL